MLSILPQLRRALVLSFILHSAAADEVPPRFAAPIDSYVAQRYGWSRRVYHVERRADAGGYAVFWVLHRDDAKRYMETGRGKSFELLCDRRTCKIVKELWFQ
jgi:hypothetical protein